MPISYKLPGFSLIEMAMVLIIMGLVAGMALPALRGIVDFQKQRLTENHQEQILYALASFALQNKSLPYACDPLNPFGKEDKGSKRLRGVVPYTSLGLPESVAKDGYQRWFTYIVDGDYAQMPKARVQGALALQPEIRLCEASLPQNPLKVKINGSEVNIAAALISHGPEGRGAYPNPLITTSQGRDEHLNATSDRQVIDRPLSQDPANPFSHTVVWVTARNLLAVYGHSPCPREKEMVPSTLPLHYSETSGETKK